MGTEHIPDFIRASMRYGSRPGLERVTRLCSLLGNPQDTLGVVHIAGTNGKGSTSAMTASALTAARYKTGLYTSPYILDVCESMRIDGKNITQAEFTAMAELLREKAAQMEREGCPPTSFEIETALAFLWFQRSGCKLAVIETGLGGRLDATNVTAAPLATVIASISYDHMSLLGNTLGEIAREKCGIIKSQGITVSYPLQPEEALSVIRETAEKKQNMLFFPDTGMLEARSAGLDGTGIVYKGLPLHIPFIGAHQVTNAVTAVEMLFALREYRGLHITDEAIAGGIAGAVMPLRQEMLCRRPVVLMDGAHNPDGLTALAHTMKAHLIGRRTAVVMGMLADKQYKPSIALIAPLCGKFIAVAPQSPRALPCAEAAAVAGEYCPDVSVGGDYAAALGEALRYAGENGAVVVCGSLYLASPMRMIYTGNS